MNLRGILKTERTRVMKVNEYGCNWCLRVETASGDVRRPLSVCLSVYANISFYSIYLSLSFSLSLRFTCQSVNTRDRCFRCLAVRPAVALNITKTSTLK